MKTLVTLVIATLTLTRLGWSADATPKAGTVGRLLAGVEVRPVDPESKQPLPAGSTGILLVRGPSVFRGYLHIRRARSVFYGQRASLLLRARVAELAPGTMYSWSAARNS